jgi:hypothetical protein
VHETKHFVVFEYLAMYQTFHKYFLDGNQYFAAENAFAQFFAVVVGQFPDGVDDTGCQIYDDENEADHERQHKRVVYKSLMHFLFLIFRIFMNGKNGISRIDASRTYHLAFAAKHTFFGFSTNMICLSAYYHQP